MMEKTFDPAAVESRIAAEWERVGAFRAGRADRAGAKTFTIVIPPPNVTGSLHMGHALNNTLQDILCRFERMRGRDVLWQPGTDHAGIATQMVVERRLAAAKEPDRRTLGREKFLEKVWTWKAESGGAIVNQLKRLGASCDWSRERFTMDAGSSKAVLKAFVELYRAGLIYKDKRLVNWDPKLLTAVSDIEVVAQTVKGHLYHFKYPLADENGRATEEYIVVATTRPETLLGDAAVAVHPDDERYAHLQGRKVVLPLVGRLIPIVADEYSDPEKGSGAVKITPAHDFNDFEVGARHGLPLINILDAEARILVRENEAFLQGVIENDDLAETLESLHGLTREEARKAVLAAMDARGLVATVESHEHQVPHGDRSGVVIEPWLTDQWYVDAKALAVEALAAVRKGDTVFVPKNWEKTYFDWLENIQPWCISRQLWWGHQIPAWYAPWGSVYVAETEEEALADALADAVKRGIYSDSEADALASDAEKSAGLLTRDEDVLDTWFSSGLWPMSTLGWPDEPNDLAQRYSTDVLVTGFDIIFFWVARMMMFGLHFMKKVPFKTVYLHALVRDEKGAKMSKSKGNVIDPLQLIDSYGADALRFTLAAMAAQGRDIKLATSRVEGYRNFATKLWNAARFAEMNQCFARPGFDAMRVNETLNKWILGETARAVAEVEAALVAYRFNDAAQAAYRFVWNILCDWHLELAKPLLQGEDGPAKQETRETIAFVLDQSAKLLHPFMPFITEELWAIAGERNPRESVLALTLWPDLKGLENAQAEAEIGRVVDLVSQVRSVRAEMNVPAAAQIPLVLVAASETDQAHARRWEETLKRLARLSEISFADAAPAQAVQVVSRGTVLALPLAGVIDFAAERARLQKAIAAEHKEIGKIDAKLGNADFLRRAPEEVVEENQERRADAVARVEKMQAALKLLG
ncbi:valyl-tRNA synthetase [Rhodoblastus acidophilus]|uniref:Valine--tRNA ligase n=1 Tax=Rhodoblastus acidophilus TaxID=1074 RepID=A0A212Q975_RHOAC|nr:valine--tRNA ligase [Rhodoblastus acidophilus]PPQ40093.1 valine--tRNA ligase [Rhodoblastus acidophilus]RAI21105.1 valine--tRNA ligase [Rhodoblastus acidophilus]SNB55882.1 valyl-tRNA synthetase [Rhodoblastus acidophilus]